MGKGQCCELPDSMLYTCRDHIVIRLILLQDQPHALHIVLRITPVTQAVQVAQLQMVLQAAGNPSGRPGNLPGHESLAAALTLMVEQDAVAGEDAVSVPVLPDHPEAVLFCHSVGGIGMEGRILVLGHLFHLAVQFGSGGLVHPAGLVQSGVVHRFQDPQHTQGIHVSGVFCRLKGNLHMALCRQVVDFIRLHASDDPADAGGVGQVALMDHQLVQNMINSGRCRHRTSSDNAVHFISLFQQQLRQIASVLSRNTSNQCLFHYSYAPLLQFC